VALDSDFLFMSLKDCEFVSRFQERSLQPNTYLYTNLYQIADMPNINRLIKFTFRIWPA